jgi:CRP-like cAMP-binding protein
MLIAVAKKARNAIFNYIAADDRRAGGGRERYALPLPQGNRTRIMPPAVLKNTPSPATLKNRLLTALPQDIEDFFSNLHPVSLLLRQILYVVGAPLEHVYFIERGVVSILTIMADGSTIEVGMIGFEGIVGVSALLGGEVTAQHFVVQVPGTALRMNAALCKRAFERNEAVRSVMLRYADAMVNLSAQTAACNRLHTIEQRLARWLLMARDRIESDIMPMTHEFLSSMLGVRRSGVTETAGELQRSGLIRYHRGQVRIIDRGALEAAACECYRIDHERLQRLL